MHDRISIAALQQKFQTFLKANPHRNLQLENIEQCSGDYIRNAKNCRYVFHCYEAEECAYGEHIWRGAKDCFDSNTAGRNAELLYETTNSGINSYNVKFSRYCWGCHNTEYSNQCKNGKYLFGCVSLKPGAEYCILNKKYSPDEYRKLIQKIKSKMLADKEYGEFFPPSIALFGYNNSVSFDEFPLTKEEVLLAKGWKWENQNSGTKNKGTIDTDKIPHQIEMVNEKITKEILTCIQCEKNYKIHPHEFVFYKTEKIPVPVKCPDCRHQSRLALRHKKIFYKVECKKCKKAIKTTLDPKKYESILCEDCYKKLLY